MQTGDLFATSGEPRTDQFRLKRRYYTLINTIGWAVVVLVPMLYYLVNLFLSGSTIYFSIGVGIIFVCKYSNFKYSIYTILSIKYYLVLP